MTNFEAVSSLIHPYKVEANVINKSLIDCKIVPGEKYSPEAKQSIAKSAISVLRQLLSLSSETNYGRSQGYDTDKLKEMIYWIAKDNELTDIAEEFDPRSRIVDRTDIW